MSGTARAQAGAKARRVVRRASFRSGGGTVTRFGDRLTALVHTGQATAPLRLGDRSADTARVRHTTLADRGLVAMIGGGGEGVFSTSTAAGYTSRGFKDTVNQDSIGHLRLTPPAAAPIDLYVVADGVGGEEAGEVASQLAVVHAFDYAYRYYDHRRKPGDDLLNGLSAALRQGICDGHHAIAEARDRLRATRRNDDLHMSTTFAAVAIQGSRGFYCGLGDSTAFGVVLGSRSNAHVLSSALFLSAPQTVAAEGKRTEREWLRASGSGNRLGQVVRNVLGMDYFDPDYIEWGWFEIPAGHAALVGASSDGKFMDNAGLGNILPRAFPSPTGLLADQIDPLLDRMETGGWVWRRPLGTGRFGRWPVRPNPVKIDHVSLILHCVQPDTSV